MAIHTSLTDEDIKTAKDFASKSVSETFDRMRRSLEERIERIFIGKIAEIAFLRYLESQSCAPADTGDMLEVWEGITNVDKYDFKTIDGELIDVKTAHKSFHRKIIIPRWLSNY